MKKSTSVITFTVLLMFTSCINYLLPVNSSDKEEPYQTAANSANVRLFIPDYRALAEKNTGRVIAPQTTGVRLSIANESGSFIQHGEVLPLDMDSLVPIANAPDNIPGSIWNGTFTALECKTYIVGSLKIELLDQDDKVITQATNLTDVVIRPNQATQALFFATPEKSNNISGTLAGGEMRFWKAAMVQGYSYKLTLAAESSWPDIVVFNNDGTFREYYSISNNAEREITFNPERTQDYYLGVWADSGEVSSYSVSLSYNFNIPDPQFEDFTDGYNGWSATASGINASPPVIVIDNGKHALEFASTEMWTGGRVYFSRTVNFAEPTKLNFSVKTNIGGSSYESNTFFKLYIDNVETGTYEGLWTPWMTESFILPAGSHEIKWTLEKDSNLYWPEPHTNKVWLTDISFQAVVPDIVEYLDISPKGPKDTYVGGFSIQYTAKALRSDGSLLPESGGIVYSGSGVDPVTGLFTPETAGTFKVTASMNGKTVHSDFITVHPADYLRMPYTNIVTGKTYYGYQGPEGAMDAVLGYVTFTNPAESNITADGFVTLEGESRFPGNLDVYLFKEGDSSLITYYPLPQGNFRIKIWLRFGPGQYTINVAGQQTFTVTNICTDTGIEGDPRFLYPSSVVQSDDFRITNLLSHILYGISNEADRIKKIHDYLVQNTVYDVASLNGTRKDQDALSVLGTKYHVDPQYEPSGHHLAVCEGYANAAAALLRAAGIETKFVASTPMNHAWNHVYSGGSWKFLDVTWDDPVYLSAGTDNGPSYVRYNYFMLTTLDGVNGDHYDHSVWNRSIIAASPGVPKMKGMPDGWY